MINKFWSSLKDNSAENSAIQLALSFIVLLFLLLSFLVSQSQPIDADERFIVDSSENFAKSGKLTTIKPSNILYLKALVYSMPYRIKLTAGWNEGRKVIAMRLFGGVIGALVIVITYVMAKQFRPRDKLLLVLSPALLAFNPGYIETMIRIGGEQIAIFIMTIIFMVTALIISSRSDLSIIDLLIAFFALYVLSRIFPSLAVRVGLVVIVLSIFIAFYLSYSEKINLFIKKSPGISIAAGIALVFIIIFFYNRSFVNDFTLSGIVSFLERAAFIPSVTFTFTDFIAGLTLGEGFGYVKFIDRYVIAFSFLLSLTGIAGYVIEKSTTVAGKQNGPDSDEKVHFQINGFILFMLFLSVWLLVNNAFIESSSYVNRTSLGVLIIPYFSVIGFGLVKLERLQKTRKVFEPALVIIFSSFLITILIRLLFRV